MWESIPVEIPGEPAEVFGVELLELGMPGFEFVVTSDFGAGRSFSWQRALVVQRADPHSSNRGTLPMAGDSS